MCTGSTVCLEGISDDRSSVSAFVQVSTASVEGFKNNIGVRQCSQGLLEAA